jgi:hypothetical protein
MILATVSGGTADNAKLQKWKGPLEDTACWWYLELVDNRYYPFADLGKAPKG